MNLFIILFKFLYRLDMKKIKSNKGTKLACKGWHQEAALKCYVII